MVSPIAVLESARPAEEQDVASVCVRVRRGVNAASVDLPLGGKLVELVQRAIVGGRPQRAIPGGGYIRRLSEFQIRL